MQGRISSVRAGMRGLDSLMVTHLPNVRYLSGFTGSSGCCLLTRKEAVFLTDFRYAEQAEADAVNISDIDKAKQTNRCRF